ncbi:MAG: MFS transporter [Chthoniobacterales bacterium]
MITSTWSPARTAICVAFFTNGFLSGTWIVHIPRIKQALAVSDGELGLLLWGATVGLLVGIISGGPLIGRFGSRKLTGVGAGAQAIATILPVVAESRVLLFTGLCIYGFFNALLDVAQNAQASHLERESDRPLMSSFHAFWSFGGFGGGAVGGLVMGWSVAPGVHVISCAVVFVLVAVWIWRILPEVSADRRQGGVVFAVPSGPLFPLAVVCYLAMFAEHAIADWSGVLLRTELNIDPPTAAIGYTAFLLAMVGARLVGDRIVEALKPVVTVSLGLGFAALGLALAVLVRNLPLAAFGFAFAGFGLGNAVPILFSAAGRIGRPTVAYAIAAVASAGYSGIFTGPAIVGGLAQWLSLPNAMLAVVFGILLALVITIGPVRRNFEGRREVSLNDCDIQRE